MVVPAVEGIDLFKIAGRSISGWIPSLKTGTDSHVRQPFCSQEAPLDFAQAVIDVDSF